MGLGLGIESLNDAELKLSELVVEVSEDERREGGGDGGEGGVGGYTDELFTGTT